MEPDKYSFDRKFINKCSDLFDINPKNKNPELHHLYPLVLSYLDSHTASRSGRFQASYSFCRSIWVILVIFSLWYALADLVQIGVFDEFYQTKSIIRQIFPEDLLLAAIGIGILSFPFLYASSAYKDNFIEYVIADFINAETIDAGD